MASVSSLAADLTARTARYVDLQRDDFLGRLDRFERHTPDEIAAFKRQVEGLRKQTYATMQKQNDASLAQIAKVPERERIVVRSATINVGQLDIAGLIGVKWAHERQHLFASAFTDALKHAPACSRGGITVPAGPIDVVEVQEVWLDDARAALRKAAEENGYVCVIADDLSAAYGLQILVRKRPGFSVLGAGVNEYTEDGHALRAAFDVIWGSRRGYAYATIALPNGRSLNVSTTHLSPLPHYEGLRGRQMVALAQTHGVTGRVCDYSIHGSDMNTPDAPGERRNAWAQTQGAMNLLGLYGSSALTDAWAATGMPIKTGTMNKRFAQFLNGEFNLQGKRIDYALASANRPGRRIGIINYGTALDGEYTTPEGKRPFSDHLMVTSTYVLA